MNKPNFKHICLMHIQQLTNFPYIEKDFDALTDYELFSKMVGYVKELNNFFINDLEQNIQKYIDENLDNILMNAMYDSTTETLRLYHEEVNNG